MKYSGYIDPIDFNDTETIPPYCEILDAKTNRGDDLFGELAGIPEEGKIDAEVSYTSKFTCEFPPPFDPIACDACLADPPNPDNPEGSCEQVCTRETPCQKQALTGLKVWVETPRADEAWERFVDGDMSVFKRFYPLPTAGAPVEEIKDIAAYTNAPYGAQSIEAVNLSGGGVTVGTGAQAGAPLSLVPGSSGKIFFPYLGGIHEYFLKGIQTALRPYGKELMSAPDDDTANCNQYLPDDAILSEFPTLGPRFLGALKVNFIDLAERWLTYDEPGSNNAEECYNDVVLRSLRANINPLFTLTIWLNESDASNYAASNQKWQDFGINIPAIAQDFNAQITRFLQVTQPGEYESLYPQCFNNSYTRMQNFMYLFHLGYRACTTKEPPEDLFYYRAIFGTLSGSPASGPWEFLSNCPIPDYPSDWSCY